MDNWISKGWDAFNSFVPVNETVSSVGSWMTDNPGGAKLLEGAAKGVAGYMSAQQKQEFDKRQAREERAWRENRSKASSGNNDYGSHTASLTKGLLAG